MTRDQAYKLFGPKLLEAILRKMVDEINVLRDFAGLEPRTQEQVIDAIEQEYINLPDYDWMGDN